MSERRLRPAWALLLAAIQLASVSAARSADPARRIVTLAPSLTELVYTAGAGGRLVGVDSVSDFPPAVRSLTRIGDAFQFDYERIVALEPDLVLVWETGTPERVIEQLIRLGLRVERISTSTLQDIAAAIRHIGVLTGTEGVAGRAADAYLAELQELRTSRRQAQVMTVFYQISTHPLYTVNGRHLISEVIGLCGGRNIFADLSQLAPPVSVEAVLERNPQVILVGNDDPDRPLNLWRKWPQLQAVRTGQLHSVNADYLSRATTRIVDGAREVCRALDEARKQYDHRPRA